MLKQEMVESLLAVTKALEEDDSYVQGYNDALEAVHDYAESVKDENERRGDIEPLSLFFGRTTNHAKFEGYVEAMRYLQNYLRFKKL